MRKIHPIPSSSKRNLSASDDDDSNVPLKRLRRLPHVFNKVLELPFRSDADVAIEETDDCLRFVADVAGDEDGEGIRAHVMEVYPGVTKPFPWFRISYFLLWTGIYVFVQWIVHACIPLPWPYPFLDLSAENAPICFTWLRLNSDILLAIPLLLTVATHYLFSFDLSPTGYVLVGISTVVLVEETTFAQCLRHLSAVYNKLDIRCQRRLGLKKVGFCADM